MAEWVYKYTGSWLEERGEITATLNGDFTLSIPYEQGAVAVYKDNIENDPIVIGQLLHYKRQSTDITDTVYNGEGDSNPAGIISVSTFDDNWINVKSLFTSIYGSNLDELGSVLASSIALHNWTGTAISLNYHDTTPQRYINWLGGDILTDNGYIKKLQNENVDCNFPATMRINGTENMTTPLPQPVLLAFYKVNEDISKGLISCSDALKTLLEENVDAGILSELGTTWTINIDGASNPTVSLTWRNALYDAVQDKIDAMSVILHVCGSVTKPVPQASNFYNLGTYLYESQPQTWTFDDLYNNGASNAAAIEKITQTLSNLVKGYTGYVGLKMQLRYVIEGDQYESCEMFGLFNSDGSFTHSYAMGTPDGSKVVFSFNNTDDFYDEFEDYLDGDIDANFSGSYGASGLSLLTKSYLLTPTDLRRLGNFLWSDDFTQNILLINNSPIQNIVSTQCFPMSITAGSSANIRLGNVDTGISAPLIPNTYRSVYDIGTFKIKPKYNNWLDYKATSVTIYLPYIGYRELPVEECMGKTIKVRYLCDLIGGSCKAQISINNIPCFEFGGQIGVNVPLTASDNSEVMVGQAQSIFNGTVGTVGNLMSGNLLGAASSAVNGALGALSIPHTFTSVGTCSSLVNSFDSHDCYIIIERPQVQYPSNYNHTFGKPCYLTARLNNMQGFTQCENVDVSTIPCTQEERRMIKDALERGVYL